MVNEYQKSKNIASFMEDLLKKYGLEERQEEIFNLGIAAKDPKESQNFFGELPSSKIIKIIKGVYKNEISEKDLPEILKKELEIDLKTAKELAHDINMEGVNIYKGREKGRIQESPEPKIEAEELPEKPEKVSPKKETAPLQVSLEKPVIQPKEPKEASPESASPPQKDAYREMPSEEEYYPKF